MLQTDKSIAKFMIDFSTKISSAIYSTEKQVTYFGYFPISFEKSLIFGHTPQNKLLSWPFFLKKVHLITTLPKCQVGVKPWQSWF